MTLINAFRILQLNASRTKPIYNPAALYSGFVWQMHGSYPSSFHTSGGKCTQIDDTSGAGSPLWPYMSQGTSYAQPAFTLSDSSFGGKSTIFLDQTSNAQYMLSSTATTLAQPLTEIMVCKAITSAQFVLSDSRSASEVAIVVAGIYGLYLYAGSSVVYTRSSLTDASTKSVVVAVANGSSSSITVNAQSAITGNAGSSSKVGCTLGATYTQTFGLHGTIAYHALVSGALSSGQIAAIITGLTAEFS